jgi:anti-anti-sigma regulatory factor
MALWPAMASFKIVWEGTVPVLQVAGKLGLDSQERLEKSLSELATCEIEDTGVVPEVMIVDLTDCPYMSSRSFPPLLRATETLASEGRKLMVVVNSGLAEILGILRLDQRLDLHASRSACLDSIG